MAFSSQDDNRFYDKIFIFSAMGLIILGLLMVASSSIMISERAYHMPFHYLLKQSVYLALGVVLGLSCLNITMDTWYRWSTPALLVSLLALMLVLVPGIGHSVNGSRRWLSLGFLAIQVSEVAKVTLLLYLSAYCVRQEKALRTTFSGFFRPLLVLAFIAVLLLREPDFGSVVVMTTVTLGILFLAGTPLVPFMGVVGMSVLSVLVIAFSQPYRLARLTTFLDPWQRQFDSGYQLTQSLIAFGRGGWWGVGLGESIQKLDYLPEAHTDFLFAVLTEELGLVGALVVMALFALLVWRTLVIGRRAAGQEQFFSAYCCYGIGLLFAFQSLINAGVNAGVLPTKGLTLPLMSYGGSSMLMNCVMLAIVLRVDSENRQQRQFSRSNV